MHFISDILSPAVSSSPSVPYFFSILSAFHQNLISFSVLSSVYHLHQYLTFFPSVSDLLQYLIFSYLFFSILYSFLQYPTSSNISSTFIFSSSVSCFLPFSIQSPPVSHLLFRIQVFAVIYHMY